MFCDQLMCKMEHDDHPNKFTFAHVTDKGLDYNINKLGFEQTRIIQGGQTTNGHKFVWAGVMRCLQ